MTAVNNLFLCLLLAVPLTAQQQSDQVRKGPSKVTLQPKTVQVTRNPSAPAIKAGSARINPKDGQQYSWIPPGSFLMGCSPGDECGEDEKLAHHVTLTKGFWLGQTEVTVGAYQRFVSEGGANMPPEPRFNQRILNPGRSDEQQPIVSVTWDQSDAFCRWDGGRLPTEAEWEYAARAGTTGPRYGDVDEIAWHAGNSGARPIDSDGIVKSGV